MEQNKDIRQNGEIILYQPDSSIRLEVRMEEDTVWLNRQQLAILFDRDIKTIGKHINNALKEELVGYPVVAKFATTASDGKTYQMDYYNLDMILSVGYRVKSKRGIDFRRWASSVLKEYLLRGGHINQRIERLEQRVSKTEEQIGLFVRTALPPVEGVFYDGQIFDAYAFASDLIRSARERIILIGRIGNPWIGNVTDRNKNGGSRPILKSPFFLDKTKSVSLIPHSTFFILNSSSYCSNTEFRLMNSGTKAFIFLTIVGISTFSDSTSISRMFLSASE